MPAVELSFASGESSLSVRHFSVREAISSPFTVAVWAASPDPSLDLASLVGRPAALRIEAGLALVQHGSRVWSGLCSYAELEDVETTPGGLSTYQIQIVPSLWLLTRRRNHRIFQHLSIPDIVDRLLAEWRIEPTWRIDRARYPKLEYKVQYGESDHAFLSRLLEEVGIAFTFEDDPRGSRITLSDAFESSVPRVLPLPFVDNPNQAAEKEFATRVRLSREVRPGAYVLRGHDFRNPGFVVEGEARRSKPPEDRCEQFQYRPGAFLVETKEAGDTPAADDRGVARHVPSHGRELAGVALAGERAGREAITFETNAFDLRPGAVFSIVGHAHPAVSPLRRLLVTEFALDGDVDEEWSAAGQAVFADLPYRPPLVTPRPVLRNVQSATVVGPAGQEIHTDEFGRVRVQFPWDREGKSSDESACWIRVGQGWGGRGYGLIALPRVGQEVLVAFLDGDPDQPVVVGRVFDGKNPVPHALPEHARKSAWKSDSSPGSKGFNEVRLDDAQGDELLYLQAERNLRALVKHDETITVLHDREKHVAAHETDTTGIDRVEVTGANRTETTGGSRITTVGTSRARWVKGGESARAEGSRGLRAGEDLDAVVAGDHRERIEGSSHLRVKGERRTQVDGSQSLTVGGSRHEKVDGRHALDVRKQLHVAGGEALVSEAAKTLTIKGSGGFITIDDLGVTIKGTLVKINVTGSPGEGRGARPEAPEDPAVGAPEGEDT